MQKPLENLKHLFCTNIPCTWKKCNHYHQVLQERKSIKKKLRRGLHLLEIKTNRDSLKRFGYQLPHYCLFGDYVWLIIETQKIPLWVPPFVGVIRFSCDEVSVEREAMKISRVPHLNQRVIKSCNPSVIHAGDCGNFLRFLRAWFINSIFYSIVGGHNIIPMPPLENLIAFYKKPKRDNYAHPLYPSLRDFMK